MKSLVKQTKLFKNAKSQYLDEAGKTRMLNYDNEVSLMTSPIPPIDLPIEDTLEIKEATLIVAQDFIKQRSLKITMQDRKQDEENIRGLWVTSKSENSGIYYGYIPIRASKPLKDVPFSPYTKNDPLRTDETSKLEDFRQSKKIAEFLKVYVLYSYALNPDNFGEKSFVILPEYVYDIKSLNKRLFKEKNKIMYDSKGRLIVQNEDIKTSLLSYLKVSILNDLPGVMALLNVSTIEANYQNISDFRSTPNQLIFTNKSSVLRWKAEIEHQQDMNVVSQILKPDSIDPYFYRNPKIKRNQLVIIQNSDGSLERALTISDKWINDKINIGANVVPIKGIEKESYVIYTEGGETLKTGRQEKIKSVILYEDGRYAALLFLV